MNNLLSSAVIFMLLFPAGHFNRVPEADGNFSETESQTAQQKKESLNTFERSFTPSFYDTEVYLYKKDDTARTFGRSIDEMTTAAPETLQGFRVQILATNVYDEALTVRNDIITRYPDLWVYTIYEVPAYKIRIGDFVNRAEATTVLNQFRAEGFRTAWIVPDRIIKNQPPKPPLPEPIDSTSTFIEE